VCEYWGQGAWESLDILEKFPELTISEILDGCDIAVLTTSQGVRLTLRRVGDNMWVEANLGVTPYTIQSLDREYKFDKETVAKYRRER